MRTTDVYPAYHTDIDNYDYQSRLIDPRLETTRVYTNLVSELVLQLSSLTRLPLDVRGLASTVSDSFNTLKSYLTQATFKDMKLLGKYFYFISYYVEHYGKFMFVCYLKVSILDEAMIRYTSAVSHTLVLNKVFSVLNSAQIYFKALSGFCCKRWNKKMDFICGKIF